MNRKERARAIAAGVGANAFGLFHPRARAGQQLGMLNQQAYMFDRHDILLDFKNGIYKSGSKIYTDPLELPEAKVTGYGLTSSGAAGAFKYLPDYTGNYVGTPQSSPLIIPGYGFYAHYPYRNYAPNPLAIGATSSSLPTGWNMDTGRMTVVGTGVEKGLPYIDVRIFTDGVTNTAAIYPALGYNVNTTSVANDRWFHSAFLKLISNTGTYNPVTQMQIRGSTDGYFRYNAPLDGTLKRYSHTALFTSSNPGVVTYIEWPIPANQAVNLVIRVAAPMVAKTIFNIDMPLFLATPGNVLGVNDTGDELLSFNYSIPNDTDFVYYGVANYDHTQDPPRVERTVSFDDYTGQNRIFSERQTLSIVVDGTFLAAPGTPITASTLGTPGRAVYAIRRRAGKWSFAVMNNARTAGVSTELATTWKPLLRFSVGSGQGTIQSYIEKAGILRGTFSDTELLNLVQGLSNRLQNKPLATIETGSGYFGSTLKAKFAETGKWQRDAGSGYVDIGDHNPSLAITKQNQGGTFRWVRSEDGAVADLPLPYKRWNFLSGVLPADLTFTRTSTATRFNADGLIESVPANTPRFDHDPVTKAPKGLLMEEGRFNYVYRSDSSSGSGQWAVSGGANITMTPNTGGSGIFSVGNPAAYIERIGTGGGYIVIPTAKPDSVAANYTASIYVKAGTAQYFSMRLQGNYPARVDAVFDLSTGTVSSNTATTNFTNPRATITPAANGWFRCTLSCTCNTDSVFHYFVSVSDSPTAQIDAASTTTGQSAYIWAPQIEKGYYPTSVILSSGATSTSRERDSCRFNGTSFFATSNSEFAILAEADYTNIAYPAGQTGYPRLLDLLGTTPNYGRTGLNVIPYPTNVELSFWTNGTAIQNAGATAPSKKAKVVINNNPATNGFSYSINGGAASLINNGTGLNPGPYTWLGIGCSWDGSSGGLNGHISLVELYARALPAADLPGLTAS